MTCYSDNHFAHVNPAACKFTAGESDAPRRCKLEIYHALQQQPGVRDVTPEKTMSCVRPDVSAISNGVLVAIEVQISTLLHETIVHRTDEYARKGIYEPWLAQWTPYLDGARSNPRLWERWVHAAYFGRVYYWVKGLEAASCHFEPYYLHVPETSWYSQGGKEMSLGDYSRKSKRWRSPVRGETLNPAKDFVPRHRERWNGGGLTVPFAKLNVGRDRHSDQAFRSEDARSQKRY